MNTIKILTQAEAEEEIKRLREELFKANELHQENFKILSSKDKEIADLREIIMTSNAELDDYKEAHESKQKLVREIGEILDGDDAVKQPYLCDLVGPIRDLKADLEQAKKEVEELKDSNREYAYDVGERMRQKDDKIYALEREIEALKKERSQLSMTIVGDNKFEILQLRAENSRLKNQQIQLLDEEFKENKSDVLFAMSAQVVESLKGEIKEIETAATKKSNAATERLNEKYQQLEQLRKEKIGMQGVIDSQAHEINLIKYANNSFQTEIATLKGDLAKFYIKHTFCVEVKQGRKDFPCEKQCEFCQKHQEP